MKWIKSRNLFLNEAKIKDVVLPKQANFIKSKWGEKYLDYEEVTPTNKIKQGIWKLSEDDKNAVLGKFMQCNIPALYELFSTLPDAFVKLIGESIDTSLIRNNKEKFEKILSDFNIKSPNLDQILIIKEPIFRKVAVGDTMATSVVSKDENGAPIRDDKGGMVRIEKKVGDILFTKNLISINDFIADYDALITKFIEAGLDTLKESDRISTRLFSHDNNMANFTNLASESHNGSYKVDFEIFNRDIYLKISHNPQDILNMSISRFYSSCQHLYGGGYNSRVLANVFDPNSIPAFLIFDTPIYDDDVLISNQLPLSRMIIRNIETFNVNEDIKLYHDRAYPDRMQSIFTEIVEKYSDNKNNYPGGEYLYTPDIETDDRLSEPYHDRLTSKTGKYIGKNIKSLHMTQIQDWSKVRIDPNAKIKELLIETTNLPESLFAIKLDLDWVKFRFLTINSLETFKNLNTDSFAFDKCKFSTDIISELPDNVKKLQIVSCDVTTMDFSKLENLEELQLIYTLDSIEDLRRCTEGLKVKKLTISGDLAGKENKPFINELKKKGIKIDVVGPVI